MERLFCRVETPAGELVLLGDEQALHGVSFTDGRCPPFENARCADAPFAIAREQLGEYFAGARRTFTLTVAAAGTDFQWRVREALTRIRHGETRTYGAVARELGTAPRAVGLANARNPLCIVVPCHRLVGRAGALTGYAGGVDRKRFLLDLERQGAT
jgi:methylated-DNA-[protein]-cysteine S-methyltransferase